MINVRRQLRIVLAALSVMSVGLSAPAHASQTEYPARPIRLIVPFSTGGGTDTIARIVTPKLTSSMGQSWIVDNRPAAGGNVGMEMAASAQPDGYTVLMGVSAPLTTNPTLYPNLPFNVIRDLQSVTKLVSSMHIVVVHPSVQASTLAEFVALAKAAPGKLNYASAGLGSTIHMAAEMFKFRTGVDLAHVPYSGGGPATLGVLTGEVQVLFGSAAATLSYVKLGKLKAFAVTGARRSVAAPSVPTVAESGYPGFEVSTWFSLMVPAKTPPVIVKRLYDEALRVVKSPDVKDVAARQGFEVETSTSPEELAAVIKTETAAWAKVIKAAAIKLD